MPPKVFPSIIPDSSEEFVDDSYSRQELDRLDGQELQSLAAKHPSDEVHGRMKAVDIKDGLEGRKRV